jgi:hypothetical protein
VKFLLQNAYLGFFINSMKVINKPQGCGLKGKGWGVRVRRDKD